MRNIPRIILLILACVLLFTSCASVAEGGEQTVDTKNETTASETDSETGEQTEAPSAPVDGITVASGNKTDYLLIKPVNTTKDVAEEIVSFTSWFSDTTGAVLYTELEGTPARSDKEIVVNCASEARADAKAAYDATSYTGFDVRVSGNRIIVTAHSRELLKKAFGYLRESIIKTDGNTYSIDKNYKRSASESFGAQVPKYDTSLGRIEGVYYCGNNAYEVSMANTTLEEAQAYVSKLVKGGFTQYALNTMGESENENAFYTLTSSSATVFVNYYKYLKSARIVITNPELYLPSTEKPQYTSVVTPSVSQTAREGASQTAPGLSMVFQLSDASFIIVDGGPYDEADEAALLAFLEEKTPGDAKPVIAAWMITHAHGDHMNLANAFIEKYYDRVDIRMAAYNFPDFNKLSVPNEVMTNSNANLFITRIKKYYPTAEHFVFHAGQKLYLADAEIEILFTHEDLYPKEASYGNHTSSMWTVTVNGIKTVILGDSEKSLCQQASDCFGSYLNADILQVSHHGFNGACLDLYQDIDPEICFWSCDELRFNGYSETGSGTPDRRTLGENANGSVWEAYDFNYWLRNTGERQHYHAQQNTTISLAVN